MEAKRERWREAMAGLSEGEEKEGEERGILRFLQP